MVKRYNLRMNKTIFLLCAATMLVVLWSGSAVAGDMRWPIKISYVSGVGDLMDLYESNLEYEGYEVDTFEWPVGIGISPYYQWDGGFRFGGGVGPIMMIMGDADHFQLPLNLTAGYTFLQDGPV
jgi:hypothetical protein